ncbi:Clavaminate synthase-like protein [Aspergillus avenaceus]|uniref:Clavaminate synthase-like protein n=1 Tax=Aspergillus avenaceus TaxID=36643 RepID=A0A5N6U4S3_ASPAV|nr:Clavaminate synthase-like protein [Aspergillus avenaceus]
MSKSPQSRNESSDDFEQVPVIDVSALSSRDPHRRQDLAAQIYYACTKVGFFYISNHGISQELLDSVHNAARRFFALPSEQKMEYYVGKSQKYRGFMPIYTEQMADMEIGDDTKNSSTGALLESFDIGYEIPLDPERTANDTLPPDTYSLYGENQWPIEEVLSGFRDIYTRYCAEALRLSRSLMRCFALALNLEEDYFDSMMKYPGVTSRMLHYPPQPVQGEIMLGLGAHMDYECFTILSQDNVPALQVQNMRGEWVLVPPIPGILVVNIGDCLSIWTNKIFRSTIHRVINLTGEERYSIPFFFGVDYDATVSVLPNCISEERPMCENPFKAGQFVRAQLAKSYVAYQGEGSGDS